MKPSNTLLASGLALVTAGCLGGLLPTAPQSTPVPVAPASTTPPAPVQAPVTTGPVTVNPVQQVDQKVTVVVPTPTPTVVPTPMPTPLPTPTPSPVVFYSQSFTVLPNVADQDWRPIWQDTGIVVEAGMTVTLEGSGQFSPARQDYEEGRYFGPYGPEGRPNSVWEGTLVPSANLASLVGKIGASSGFLVGNKVSFVSKNSGSLALAMNTLYAHDQTGKFTCVITLAK